MSDDETREDPDVEAHKKGLPATDEAEGDGDDVEAHRHDVGKHYVGKHDVGKHDVG